MAELHEGIEQGFYLTPPAPTITLDHPVMSMKKMMKDFNLVVNCTFSSVINAGSILRWVSKLLDVRQIICSWVECANLECFAPLV